MLVYLGRSLVSGRVPEVRRVVRVEQPTYQRRTLTGEEIDDLTAAVSLCEEQGWNAAANLYRAMLERWAGVSVPVTPRTVVFVSSSSMAEGLTDRQRAQTAVVKRILLDGLNPFDNDTREAYGLARGNW